MDYIVVARLLSCAAKLSIDRYSLCVGYLSQPGTHWAKFIKKVHKPQYWTLEVAKVKKARLGSKMHLVSFHIFCKLEYFGL
jgi:hypothetical protein